MKRRNFFKRLFGGAAAIVGASVLPKRADSDIITYNGDGTIHVKAGSGLASRPEVVNEARFIDGIITVDFNRGVAHQKVSLTADATALNLIPPGGPIEHACTLTLTTIDADRTIGGFSSVRWFHTYDLAPRKAFTIPKDEFVILSFYYNGETWVGHCTPEA